MTSKALLYAIVIAASYLTSYNVRCNVSEQVLAAKTEYMKVENGDGSLSYKIMMQGPIKQGAIESTQGWRYYFLNKEAEEFIDAISVN